MKFTAKTFGELSFACDRHALPYLRLLQHYAPLLRLEGKTGDGRSFLVALGAIALETGREER